MKHLLGLDELSERKADAGAPAQHTAAPATDGDAVQVLVHSADGMEILTVSLYRSDEFTVWDLKQRISDAIGVPSELQVLSMAQQRLEDTQRLPELAGSSGQIVLELLPEGCLEKDLDPGPFPLGHEAFCGQWEGTSPQSGPLPGLDGTWQLLAQPTATVAEWLRQFTITGMTVQCMNGEVCLLEVRQARVLLEGGALQLRGDELLRAGTTGVLYRFTRVVPEPALTAE